MKSLFSLILLVLLSNVAFANNKVGNGGDVVHCKSSTRLLDFYEDDVELKSSKKDYKEIVKDQFARFEKTAPKVFKPFQKRLTAFESEIDFKPNVRLKDIKDSNEFFLPKDKDCELVQIAIRKKSITADEKRFLVDKELWNKLDENHKAGLIAHEIIYEHLSQLGEVDSTKARKLNRFVFNVKSKDTDFWKFIQDLKLPLYP